MYITYVCIYTYLSPSIFTGREKYSGRETALYRRSLSHGHLHRVGPLYSPLASRDRTTRLPKDGTRARVRCGTVTKKRRRRERASERASKRARWEEKEKKRQRSTSFLSRLPGRTVCILSRAAPREFNSIFNLPKPLYANSATDVEYFWTFSSRFCVPSAPRSPLPLPSTSALSTSLFLSHTLSFPLPLSLFLFLCILFVLLCGAASFYSNPSSERRHTFPSLLAPFTNVAKRVFGRRF